MERKSRRFAIGDIHGRYKALKEVLKKSKFNYKKDLLTVLGDIVDGGSNTYSVVEELLKIENLVFVLGNHDVWWMNHISSGWAENIWLAQGGYATIESYGGKVTVRNGRAYVKMNGINVPVTHQEFFNKGVYYYELDDMLFVHGGFDLIKGLKNTDKYTFVWDRELISTSRYKDIQGFKKIFVGHTTTQTYDSLFPLKFHNLWMLDTGAGWNGSLTIMDIDTEKFWQSKLQLPNRLEENKNG